MLGFDYSNRYVLNHILQLVTIKPNQLFYRQDNRNYIYHYDLSCYETLLTNLSKISDRLCLVGKIQDAYVSVNIIDDVCVLRVSQI